jgi:serralysin
MDDDILVGADSSDALHFDGVYATQDDVSIVRTATTATIVIGGVDIDMDGDFTDGEFMIDARGSGSDADTTVTFVSYLPTLGEGVSVNPDAINGVANQAFLTGDGTLDFTLSLLSAVSAFSNTLGFYKVDADGNIFDVNIVFANTLSPGTTTFDLGAPGDGVQLGFFLIQDGFDLFGNLSESLAFVLSGGQAANIDAGEPLFLQSATLGMLSGATIFHSFADLNPDGADQVLSGVVPGGRQLQIGFEDLPTASGDNDFQDVVIVIRLTDDSIL